MKKQFGRRLRTLRQLANLTQLELAELVGISDRYLGRVERGLVSPSFESIDRIARALKTQPANLFLFSADTGIPEQEPPLGSGFLQMSHIGSWEYSGPGAPCRLSPSVLSLLGYPPSSTRRLGRKRLLGHVLPEDLAAARALVESVDALRAHPVTPLRIRRRDGQLRHVIVTVEPDGTGGVLGAAIDATDHRRFEELLSASKDSLEQMIRDRTAHLSSTVARLEGEVDLRSRTERSLLKAEQEKLSILSSLEGVVIKRLDPQYRLLWVNEAVTTRSGFAMPDLIGRACYSACAHRKDPCPGCPVEEALSAGAVADGEITTSDGRRWLARATPLLDEHGRVESVLFMGFDVSERISTRLALEEAIRERAALLQGLSGMTVKYVDTDMRIVWASTNDPNSPVAKGKPYVGLPCHASFAHRDTPCPGCRLPEVLKTQTPWEGEFTAPSGRTFIVRCNPVLAGDGTLKGAVHMAFDISERTRMEQELVQARLFLEHLLASCAAVLFTCTADGDHAITYISDNVSAVFGHPAKAFTGNVSFWEANLYPGEKERLQARLPLLFQQGNLEQQFRFRHGNGSWRWTRADLRLVRKEPEGRLEIVGSWIDITEAKASELALRDSEYRYRELFLANRTAQLLIDAETGAILGANQAASDLYGYPGDALRRMNIADINVLPPEEVAKVLVMVRASECPVYRFRHRLASGEVREVEARITPMKLGERLVNHAMIIDLGERD